MFHGYVKLPEIYHPVNVLHRCGQPIMNVDGFPRETPPAGPLDGASAGRPLSKEQTDTLRQVGRDRGVRKCS